MSMFDMLEGAVGGAAMQQIAQRVGLPPEQLQSVVASLGPKILPQLHSQAQQGQLDSAAVGQAPPAGSDEAEDHGNSVLGSILGSKEASSSVAQETAADTGVSADKVKQVLPQLASVFAGAMQQGKFQSGAGLGSLLSGMSL